MTIIITTEQVTNVLVGTDNRLLVAEDEDTTVLVGQSDSPVVYGEAVVTPILLDDSTTYVVAAALQGPAGPQGPAGTLPTILDGGTF